MIKYLFIVINSISIYILSFFSGDNGIKLNHNIPASVTAGREIPVEFRISKGDLAAMGRLTIELPEGMTIMSDGGEGFQFVFEENKAKWVWDSLPRESEIAVKMILVASAGTVGERVIDARFSYLENNEKQFVDMEPLTVNVLPSEALPGEAVLPKNNDSAAVSQVPQGSNAEPTGTIVIERVIKRDEKTKDYLVSVKIRKGNTKGFARYSDDTHENVTARAIKTDGGSFSIADGKVKFVWVNVPEKEELEITYLLTGKPNKTVILQGEYMYLEDNQSKTLLLKSDTIDFGQGVKSNDGKNQKTDTTGNNAQQTVKAGKVEKTVKSDASALPTDGKAAFEVQIGAFTSGNITASRLKNKFNIAENIRSETQAGFSKFLVGSHKEYKNAREHRETVKSVNGVKSAFVVAYNDGKRITVQEALMLTNQRWFK